MTGQLETDRAAGTTDGQKASGRQKLTTRQKRNLRIGLLFVSPWIVGVAAFVVYPLIYSVAISFTQYSGMQTPTFIGFQNYVAAFKDPMVHTSVGNTLFYMALAVPIGLIIALLPPTQTSFFSDRQMFQITGPWGVGSQRDYRPKMEYGVTHLPIVDESADPFTWAGGFALTMPKGSSKSKAAWDLMKFYAGYEGQKTLLKDISRIPTNIQAAQDPNAWDPDIAFFVEQMAVAKSRLPLPVGSKVWDSMFTMQESLNQASKTPQEAVEIAQNYVNPTMQQFCPMTLPKGFGEPDPTFTK